MQPIGPAYVNNHNISLDIFEFELGASHLRSQEQPIEAAFVYVHSGGCPKWPVGKPGGRKLIFF